MGEDEGEGWFGCGWCGGNVRGFMGWVGRYGYGSEENEIYVKVYIEGKGEMERGDNKVRVEESREYGWNGKVRMKVSGEKEGKFGMGVGMGGWRKGGGVGCELYG